MVPPETDRVTTPSASEALFRGLLEFAPDAIVIVDRDGAITLVNSQAEQMFGYGRGELIGQPVEILLPDALKALHVEHRRRFFEEPRTRPMGAGRDLSARRKDGSELPVEISLSPFQTEDGLVVTSVIRDITDRRKAQADLETRAQQQAVVAELGQRALLGTDLTTLMEEAVTRVARTLRVEFAGVLQSGPDRDGFSLVAGVGWGSGDLGGPALRAEAAAHAEYAILADRPLAVAYLAGETRFDPSFLIEEHRAVSVAAAIIYVQNRAIGVLDVHSTHHRAFMPDDVNFLQATANVLAAAIERTRAERLQRERDLLRSEQMAAVGRVAAGVAHELRNPLTSIKGLIQVNCKEAEAKGLPSEDLRVIEQEIRRMERTLGAFLDFARLPEPERHHQDLTLLVDRTLSLVRSQIDGQGVVLDVVRPSSPVAADVDGDQIQQLLLNLVLNSLDEMPGGGTLRIELRPSRHGRVAVEVRDTGPGIPPALLPRIFDPFVSGKKSGLGLGLAVSRRIAEDHGGSLEVVNLPGGGANFVLLLPASPPA